MQINRVCMVYFSPTGTTKKVMMELAKYFDKPVVHFDLTNYKAHGEEQTFHTTDFVMIGIPVYGGRVPETMVERLQNVQGHRTPMAMVATYGNRAYEDALLELKVITEENGFKTIGAAAIVTEHSIVHEVGAGRPNEQDKQLMKGFAQELTHKLEQMNQVMEEADLHVKGNVPYRKRSANTMFPHTTDACNGCMNCLRHCPTGAIVMKGKAKTNRTRCIGCMRCIQICPKSARFISAHRMSAINKRLTKICTEENVSETFL